jgi:hypothetical protein
MSGGNGKPMNIEELAHTAQMLGTPIDFEELIEAGVLRRKTKHTYELLDSARLPEYVRRQATSMKASSKGKPVVVTFAQSNKRAQKAYESLTGKKFTPAEQKTPRSK